jgi:hypothetical protein
MASSPFFLPSKEQNGDKFPDLSVQKIKIFFRLGL